MYKRKLRTPTARLSVRRLSSRARATCWGTEPAVQQSDEADEPPLVPPSASRARHSASTGGLAAYPCVGMKG
jgi:hypothetical protein